MAVTISQLTRSLDFEEALNKLDDALNKTLSELSNAIGPQNTKQIGINISNVVLGNVSGILIVAYALVDGDDEVRKENK
jgi:tetrahydromethanopterin S-methyltransferase subunit G